jgi:Tol biopolymer transport system component
MDNKGKQVKRLTVGHDSYGGASWSPDSKRIAFHSPASGINEIYILDLESGTITQLTHCK